MTLTESGQIIPEQSTAAIVVHHPDAKYFVFVTFFVRLTNLIIFLKIYSIH